MKKIHTLIFFIFFTGILFTRTHTYDNYAKVVAVGYERKF